MKKLTVLLLTLLTLCTATLSVSAAGTDDGTVTVTEINGAKYFGVGMISGAVKYVAASGDESYFYDLTDDREMDVCDLVAQANRQLDLDESGDFSFYDTEMLRIMLLIGNK